MSRPDLFYTPDEVASMFRLTTPALNSQRKRGLKPGSLAVKVGGKYLYPTGLVDHYLDELAKTAQENHDLEESLVADLFRTPPTNTRVLTLPEAAEFLSLEASELNEQWERDVYPGALGWRAMPGAEIVFAPRELEIWIEASANEERQDVPSAESD